jgi:hypothetical protein
MSDKKNGKVSFEINISISQILVQIAIIYHLINFYNNGELYYIGSAIFITIFLAFIEIRKGK